MALLGGVVKKLLDGLLKDYVHGDFDIAISLFGKHAVDLESLELKCDVLNDLSFGDMLPIKFTYIYIGRATLDIPFSRLGSRPCELRVYDGIVIFEPNLEAAWDPKHAEEELNIRKQDIILELLEKIKPKVAPTMEKNSSNYFGLLGSRGLLNRTLTRILDNLQISLENVHVRWEMPNILDPPKLLSTQTKSPERLFFGGLPHVWPEDNQNIGSIYSAHVSSLSMVTTNSAFEPHFDDDCDSIVFKVISLGKLDIIWEPKGTLMRCMKPPQVHVSEVFTLYTDYYQDLLQTIRNGPWNIQSPRYVVGPIRGELRIRLNTVTNMEQNAPHNIDLQLSLSPMMFRFLHQDVAVLIQILNHFLRHSAFIDRVAIHRQENLRAKIAEAESPTGALYHYIQENGLEGSPFREIYKNLIKDRARMTTLSESKSTDTKQESPDKYATVIELLEMYLPEPLVRACLIYASDEGLKIRSKSLATRPSSGIINLNMHSRAQNVTQGAVSASGYGLENENMDESNPELVNSIRRAFEKDLVKDLPPCSMNEFEVTFPAGETGLCLDQGFVGESVVVTSCIPGSPAAQMRLIEPGMVITAIGNTSVVEKPASETLSIFAKEKRPMRVRFQGSELAARNAKNYLIGTKVNFFRLMIALNGLDIALLATPTEAPLSCIRMSSLCFSYNSTSSSPAIGFWARRDCIVNAETRVAIAFFDIVDIPRGTPKLSSVHYLLTTLTSSDGFCTDTFSLQDLRLISPFHQLDKPENEVSELMKNRNWLHACWMQMNLLWCWHLETAPPTSSFLITPIEFLNFSQWKSTANILAYSLFPRHATSSDNSFIMRTNSWEHEFFYRMHRLPQVCHRLSRSIWGYLSMDSEYEDTFTVVSTKNSRFDEIYCYSKISGFINDIVLNAEDNSLKPLVQYFADMHELSRDSWGIPGYPDTFNACDLFIEEWTTYEWDVRIGKLELKLESSIFEKFQEEIGQVFLEVGPARVVSELSSQSQAIESNCLDKLDGERFYLVLDRAALYISPMNRQRYSPKSCRRKVSSKHKSGEIIGGYDDEEVFFDSIGSSRQILGPVIKDTGDTASVDTSVDSFADAQEELDTHQLSDESSDDDDVDDDDLNNSFAVQYTPIALLLFQAPVVRFNFSGAPVCSYPVQVSFIAMPITGALPLFPHSIHIALSVFNINLALKAWDGIIRYVYALPMPPPHLHLVKNPFKRIVRDNPRMSSANARTLEKLVSDAVTGIFLDKYKLLTQGECIMEVYEAIVETLGKNYGLYMLYEQNFSPQRFVNCTINEAVAFLADYLFYRFIRDDTARRKSITAAHQRSPSVSRSRASTDGLTQGLTFHKNLADSNNVSSSGAGIEFQLIVRDATITLLDLAEIRTTSLELRVLPIPKHINAKISIRNLEIVNLISGRQLVEYIVRDRSIVAVSMQMRRYAGASAIDDMGEEIDDMSDSDDDTPVNRNASLNLFGSQMSEVLNANNTIVNAMLTAERATEIDQRKSLNRLFVKSLKQNHQLTGIRIDSRSIPVLGKGTPSRTFIGSLRKLEGVKKFSKPLWKAIKEPVRLAIRTEIKRNGSLPKIDIRFQISDINIILNKNARTLFTSLQNALANVEFGILAGEPSYESLELFSRVSAAFDIDGLGFTFEIVNENAVRQLNKSKTYSVRSMRRIGASTSDTVSLHRVVIETNVSWSGGYIARYDGEKAVVNFDRTSLHLIYPKQSQSNSRFVAENVMHSLLKPWKGSFHYSLSRATAHDLVRNVRLKVSPIRVSAWAEDAVPVIMVVNAVRSLVETNDTRTRAQRSVSKVSMRHMINWEEKPVLQLATNTYSILGGVLSEYVDVSQMSCSNYGLHIFELLENPSLSDAVVTHMKIRSLMNSFADIFIGCSLYHRKFAKYDMSDKTSELVEIGNLSDSFHIEIQQLQVELVREIFRGVAPVETFLPVQKVAIENIKCAAESKSNWKEDYLVAVELDVEAQYYSVRLGAWEYSIEPWRNVRLGYCSDRVFAENICHAYARQRLNFNASDELLLLTMDLYRSYSNTLYASWEQETVKNDLDEKPLQVLSINSAGAAVETDNVSSSTIRSVKSRSRHLRRMHGQGAKRQLTGKKTSSASIKSKTKTAVTKNINGHWLINKTGVPGRVFDLYQIGVNVRGTLIIEFKDGWQCPTMRRWLSRPEIGMTVTPHNVHAGSTCFLAAMDGEILSDASSTMSADSASESDASSHAENPEINRQEGDFFYLHLMESKHDILPQLVLRVKHTDGTTLRGTVDLSPHILFPLTPTSEWISLFPFTDNVDATAEILLRIIFQPYVSGTNGVKEDTSPSASSYVPWSLEVDSVATVDFSSIAKKHWFQTLNRKQIADTLHRQQTNMLQAVGVDFSVGTHLPEMKIVVPMDDTGNCIMSISTSTQQSESKDPAAATEKGKKIPRVASIPLLSGMVNRRQRVFLLESPVQIKNTTNIPISICVLEKSHLLQQDSRYDTLDIVGIDLSEMRSSGSYLDTIGLGVRNIVDRSSASKWVDGGHRPSESTSNLAEWGVDPGSSWVEWNFENPTAVCFYRIFPCGNKISIESHARLDQKGKVDSRYIGLDPTGWRLQGKSRVNETWVTLHTVTIPEGFPIHPRKPVEYWTDFVDDFTFYRIVFDPLPVQPIDPSVVDYWDNDSMEMNQGLASRAPNNTYPIGISGVDFFCERKGLEAPDDENKTFLSEANEMAKFLQPEKDFQTDLKIHDEELKQLWNCSLCGDLNSNTFDDCSTCGAVRDEYTKVPTQKPMVSSRHLIAKDTFELMNQRKTRADKIKSRAFSIGTDVETYLAPRKNEILNESKVKIMVVGDSGKRHKDENSTLSLKNFCYIVASSKRAGFESGKGIISRSKERLVALDASSKLVENKRLLEFSLSHVHVVNVKRNTKGTDKPNYEDLANVAKTGRYKSLSCKFEDAESFDVWSKRIQSLISEKVKESLTHQEDTMYLKTIYPHQHMNVPLSFLFSDKQWKIVVRPLVVSERPPVEWVELIPDIDYLDTKQFREQSLRRRRNLLCKPKVKMVQDDYVDPQCFTFAAYIFSKNQPRYNANFHETGSHGIVDGQFLEKQKIYVEPWGILKNRLPYSVLIQCSTSPTATEPLLVLPNEEMQLVEIDYRVATIRIKIPELDTSFSTPVKIEEFTVGLSSNMLEKTTRIPLYRSGFQNQPLNLVGHVEFGRARKKGRLQLLLYASFWITNFSDVPILIRPRSHGQSDIPADSLLEPNFDPNSKISVLPMLACESTRNFDIAVVCSREQLETHGSFHSTTIPDLLDFHVAEGSPFLKSRYEDAAEVDIGDGSSAIQKIRHAWLGTYHSSTEKSQVLRSPYSTKVEARVGGSVLSKSFGFRVSALTYVRRDIAIEIKPHTQSFPMVMSISFRVNYYFINNLPRHLNIRIKQLPYKYRVEKTASKVRHTFVQTTVPPKQMYPVDTHGMELVDSHDHEQITVEPEPPTGIRTSNFTDTSSLRRAELMSDSALPEIPDEVAHSYRAVVLPGSTGASFHFNGFEQLLMRTRHWHIPIGVTLQLVDGASGEPLTKKSGPLYFKEGTYSVALRSRFSSLRERFGATHVRLDVHRQGGCYYCIISGDEMIVDRVPMPLYEIRNSTHYAVELSQIQGKNLIVEPLENIKYAWDLPMGGSIVAARPVAPHKNGSIREHGSPVGKRYTSVGTERMYNVNELKSMNPLVVDNDGTVISVKVRIVGVTRVLEFYDISSYSASASASTIETETEDDCAQFDDMEFQHVLSMKLCLKENADGSGFRRNRSYLVELSCGDVFRELPHFANISTFNRNSTTDEVDLTIRFSERPVRMMLRVYDERTKELVGAFVTGIPDPLWTNFASTWIDIEGDIWNDMLHDAKHRSHHVLERAEALLHPLSNSNARYWVSKKDGKTSQELNHLANQHSELASGSGRTRRTSVTHFQANPTVLEEDEESDVASAHDGDERIGLLAEDSGTVLGPVEHSSNIALCIFSTTAAPVSQHLHWGNPFARLSKKKQNSSALAAWIQIKCTPLRNDLVEFQTYMDLNITSIGVSLILSEKKIEVAYLIAQRIRIQYLQCSRTEWITGSIGHVQADNHDPNGAYDIILSREGKVTGDDINISQLEIVLRQGPDLRYLSLESLVANFSALTLALDRVLLENLIEVYSQIMDVADASDVHLEKSFGYDADNMQVSNLSVLSNMIYVGTIQISKIDLLLKVNIPGSKNSVFETSIKIQKLPLLVLAYERNYVFEPLLEFRRKWMDFLWNQIIRVNLPKVLTNTQVVVNPLPPLVRVLRGVVDLVWQPINSCYRECSPKIRGPRGPGLCFCFCYGGLQSGMISFIGHGTNGMMLGANAIFTLSSDFVDDSGVSDVDVVMSPIYMFLMRLKNVSHALTYSSEVVLGETLGRGPPPQPQIRETRIFSERGEIMLYGPGNLPIEKQRNVEILAASRIARFWRNISKYKPTISFTREQILEQARQEAHAKDTWWGIMNRHVKDFWREYQG